MGLRWRTPRQRATVITVAGLGALVTGAFAAIQVATEVAFEQRALRLDGEVVGLRPQQVHEARGYAYAPIFRLTPPGAAPRDIASRFGTQPPAWAIGERSVVLFDPGAPDRVVADTVGQRWGLPLVFGGVSLVFALVSIATLRS